MIYFTGDIHGAVDGIADFINKIHPTMEDVIVLLGDVGANYYTGRRDNLLKAFLNDAGTVFLCIHGNHERRPTTIPGYVETEWHGGKAWVQPEYPNLIFAKDGEIYTLNGLRYLVIGGAYSVDKYYRLCRGWGWWPDEQPSQEIKAYTTVATERRRNSIISMRMVGTKGFGILILTIPRHSMPGSMTTPAEADIPGKYAEAVTQRMFLCGRWTTKTDISSIWTGTHGTELLRRSSSILP